jgi:hypothetical protein
MIVMIQINVLIRVITNLNFYRTWKDHINEIEQPLVEKRMVTHCLCWCCLGLNKKVLQLFGLSPQGEELP